LEEPVAGFAIDTGMAAKPKNPKISVSEILDCAVQRWLNGETITMK
jgi:hypothetical protein